MKRYLPLSLIFSIFIMLSFQSCSSDDGNALTENYPKEVTANNVNKKWTAVYFEFQVEGVKRPDREYYQKSLIDIELKKDGTFASFDNYHEVSKQGKYVMNGNGKSIVLTYSSGEEVSFVIETLEDQLMIVKPHKHKVISTIELVPSVR